MIQKKWPIGAIFLYLHLVFKINNESSPILIRCNLQ